jgi:hypothetical protein
MIFKQIGKHFFGFKALESLHFLCLLKLLPKNADVPLDRPARGAFRGVSREF